MSAVETDRFRTALLEERSRVASAIDYLHEESPPTSGDRGEITIDQHLADTASETLEREIDYTLEENSGHVLEEIDRALARIDDGTYGRCEACGGDIGVERLEALPYATQCIECKRRHSR
jgi:RNA polymerase-binding transcription factor